MIEGFKDKGLFKNPMSMFIAIGILSIVLFFAQVIPQKVYAETIKDGMNYSGAGSHATTIQHKCIVVAPGSVANIKATRPTSKSIKLTWNKVKGASGYEVFRCNSSNGNYKIIARTPYSYFTNLSLITTSGTYYYKIRAYKTVGNTRVYCNYWSSIVVKAIPVTIKTISDVSVMVKQNKSYKLPSTVNAKMSNGSTKHVGVTWNTTRVNTGKAGKYMFVGTVKGYSKKVSLRLTVYHVPSSYKDAVNMILQEDGKYLKRVYKNENLNPQLIGISYIKNYERSWDIPNEKAYLIEIDEMSDYFVGINSGNIYALPHQGRFRAYQIKKNTTYKYFRFKESNGTYDENKYPNANYNYNWHNY